MPKSKDGSDRISNLTLACLACDQAKSDTPVGDFLTDKTKLERFLKPAKQPLHDAAAVNATRFAVFSMAKTFLES